MIVHRTTTSTTTTLTEEEEEEGEKEHDVCVCILYMHSFHHPAKSVQSLNLVVRSFSFLTTRRSLLSLSPLYPCLFFPLFFFFFRRKHARTNERTNELTKATTNRVMMATMIPPRGNTDSASTMIPGNSPITSRELVCCCRCCCVLLLCVVVVRCSVLLCVVVGPQHHTTITCYIVFVLGGIYIIVPRW